MTKLHNCKIGQRSLAGAQECNVLHTKQHKSRNISRRNENEMRRQRRFRCIPFSPRENRLVPISGELLTITPRSFIGRNQVWDSVIRPTVTLQISHNFKRMNITTPEIQCITYTDLISKCGEILVDSRRLMQYVQIPMSCSTLTINPKPGIITPQAILIGGCNQIRIWPLRNVHSGASDSDSGSDIGNALLYSALSKSQFVLHTSRPSS